MIEHKSDLITVFILVSIPKQIFFVFVLISDPNLVSVIEKEHRVWCQPFKKRVNHANPKAQSFAKLTKSTLPFQQVALMLHEIVRLNIIL